MYEILFILRSPIKSNCINTIVAIGDTYYNEILIRLLKKVTFKRGHKLTQIKLIMLLYWRDSERAHCSFHVNEYTRT